MPRSLYGRKLRRFGNVARQSAWDARLERKGVYQLDGEPTLFILDLPEWPSRNTPSIPPSTSQS